MRFRAILALWPFYALGIIVIAFIWAISHKPAPLPQQSPYEVTKKNEASDYFEVKNIAEQVVKDRLKAPSTAKFVQSDAALNKKGSWDVYGEVDSQNSYGAMLRSRYLCSMHKEKDKWQITKVSIW